MTYAPVASASTWAETMVPIGVDPGRRSEPDSVSLGMRWERLNRRRPEWWLLALAMLAWLLVPALHSTTGLSIGGDPAVAGHAHHPHPADLAPVSTRDVWPRALGMWSAMVVAMMLPIVAPQARWLALRSLRTRRAATMAMFAAGYLMVWVVVGSVAVVVLAPTQGVRWSVPLVLLVAAGYQVSAVRQRALDRCGVLQAPRIRGWGASLDCLRSGGRSGVSCVRTCWALMIPMAVSHQLWLMVAVFAVMWHERRPRPNPERRAVRSLEAGVLVVLALVAWLLPA